MYICARCHEKTDQGRYTNKNVFICRNCLPFFNELHLNYYKIENGEVITISPFSNVNETNQRALFIDYCYKLFNNKLNPAAYRLMNSYSKKGYTWLGMLQAMEYFYIVKKNSINKSNNNIGIIPHVYLDAQKYYDYENKKQFLNYKNNLDQLKKQENNSKTIMIEDKKNKKELDLNLL